MMMMVVEGCNSNKESKGQLGSEAVALALFGTAAAVCRRCRRRRRSQQVVVVSSMSKMLVVVVVSCSSCLS